MLTLKASTPNTIALQRELVDAAVRAVLADARFFRRERERANHDRYAGEILALMLRETGRLNAEAMAGLISMLECYRDSDHRAQLPASAVA